MNWITMAAFLGFCGGVIITCVLFPILQRHDSQNPRGIAAQTPTEVFIRRDGTLHADRAEYEREMLKQGLEPKPVDNFAVTGEPRRVPWHIRKKELEAGARKKRQQRDEYRSIA